MHSSFNAHGPQPTLKLIATKGGFGPQFDDAYWLGDRPVCDLKARLKLLRAEYPRSNAMDETGTWPKPSNSFARQSGSKSRRRIMLYHPTKAHAARTSLRCRGSVQLVRLKELLHQVVAEPPRRPFRPMWRADRQLALGQCPRLWQSVPDRLPACEANRKKRLCQEQVDPKKPGIRKPRPRCSLQSVWICRAVTGLVPNAGQDTA